MISQCTLAKNRVSKGKKQLRLAPVVIVQILTNSAQSPQLNYAANRAAELPRTCIRLAVVFPNTTDASCHVPVVSDGHNGREHRDVTTIVTIAARGPSASCGTSHGHSRVPPGTAECVCVPLGPSRATQQCYVARDGPSGTHFEHCDNRHNA